MTYQNHPQPRYFVVVAIFCFLIVAQGAGALLGTQPADKQEDGQSRETGEAASVLFKENASGAKAQVEFATSAARLKSCPDTKPGLQNISKTPIFQIRSSATLLGWAVVALAGITAAFNGLQTVNYAAHPEYTFVDAARRLTQYIDAHPNGNRLLLSISGDQITLVTHLPTLCDDFGTQDLETRLARYQPGWWATWNDIDPGTLEDLHTHFSLEQVASFRAFDDPERNVLVLFKLHPLPGGEVRSYGDRNLKVPLPGDKIEIPLQ
jgi:hypothetical protein